MKTESIKIKMQFKKIIILIWLLLIAFSSYPQENNIKKHTLGLNITQLPALTIDINYDYAIKPYLDFVGNIGYSFNYIYSGDLNWILVSHIKCGNCGIAIKNQTGGFIKTGIKFNTRKTFEKRSYFFLGINIINSVVYEKVDFTDYYGDCESNIPQNIIIIDDPIRKQVKYIFGLGTQIGYSFKMSNKLQSDLGLQVAFPNSNYKSLFGYKNFISGIESKDSYSYWFPTMIFNIKYMIE